MYILGRNHRIAPWTYCCLPQSLKNQTSAISGVLLSSKFVTNYILRNPKSRPPNQQLSRLSKVELSKSSFVKASASLFCRTLPLLESCPKKISRTQDPRIFAKHATKKCDFRVCEMMDVHINIHCFIKYLSFEGI